MVLNLCGSLKRNARSARDLDMVNAEFIMPVSMHNMMLQNSHMTICLTMQEDMPERDASTSLINLSNGNGEIIS